MTDAHDRTTVPAPTPAQNKRRKNRPGPGSDAAITAGDGSGFDVPVGETGEMFHSIWRLGE